jgi:pimeloyl-ACP methyl ester carboxylesterase
MNRDKQLTCVILGGFLSRPSFYSSMKNGIKSLSGYDVKTVEIPQLLWLSVSLPFGWIPILKRLDRTIGQIHDSKSPAPLIVIGHSLGGVLGSLYIAAPPVKAIEFRGRKHVRHLVTLGSPHQNHCRWFHGGAVSRAAARWAPEHSPKDDVHITCIIGQTVKGNQKGTLEQRKAFTMYKKLAGEGDGWGDGIIPASSALISGADHIILKNVRHFSRSGGFWYGSTEVINRWWPLLSISGAYLRKEALEKI